jgi:hypothetical protein
MHGQEMDFDPDALCQNLVVGLLGYHTPDGLTSDTWANPDPVPPLHEIRELDQQQTPAFGGGDLPPAASLTDGQLLAVARRHNQGGAGFMFKFDDRALLQMLREIVVAPPPGVLCTVEQFNALLDIAHYAFHILDDSDQEISESDDGRALGDAIERFCGDTLDPHEMIRELRPTSTKEASNG